MLHPQEKVHAPEQKFRPCICLWPLLLLRKPSIVNFPRPTSNKVPTIALTMLRRKRSA